MNIDEIRDLVQTDLDGLDRTIIQRLSSDVFLINQVAQYIISAGGKRLRPLLVVCAARACGYEGSDHVNAAAIIEFIHTATLLHDDVVDGSDLRRGQDTANAVFGNEASVLVGDFLYSRAFQMLNDIGDRRVLKVVADASNMIAEGEVLQLMNCGDPDTTEERYLEVIKRKTAMLFEAGTRIAAIVSGQPQDVEEALADYGQKLGIAFQLVDDALDYSSSADEMGKNVGDDLAEGKPTLPLIRAMEKAGAADRELIRDAIRNGGIDQLNRITEIITSTGALDYTAERAQQAADIAIDVLDGIPESDYKQALIALADFSVQRRS